MTETVEKIRERKGFYMHYYRVAVTVLRFALVLILLLIIGIVLVRASYQEPLAYATSSDGMLEPLKIYSQSPYTPQKN